MGKYEVSYYDYALTDRKARNFFTAIAAIIFAKILLRRFGKECYPVIEEKV